MTRGRYMDSVRRSAPSPSSFLRAFAEDKVETKEVEKEPSSPIHYAASSAQEKLIRDYENDPNPPGGVVQMVYHAAKKSRGEF